MAEGMPSAMVRRLRTGELDLAVIWDMPEGGDDMSEGVEMEHLFDDPWTIVLHPDHPLAGRDRVRPRDLADEDWLLPSFSPDGASARLLRRMCAAEGFEPRIAFRVNDCQMTKALVAAGEGVSLIPRMMLEPGGADVAVKAVQGKGISRRVSIVRVPARYLTPAAQAFKDCLRSAAAAHAQPEPS